MAPPLSPPGALAAIGIPSPAPPALALRSKAVLEGENDDAAPAIPTAAVAGEGVIDVVCKDCDKKELRPEVEDDDNGDAPPRDDAMDDADPMLPTIGV